MIMFNKLKPFCTECEALYIPDSKIVGISSYTWLQSRRDNRSLCTVQYNTVYIGEVDLIGSYTLIIGR